jgi:membrane associated rhomboid family serine protease
MIPIRDVNPRRTFPYVNVALIAVNIGFFLWEVSLGTRVNAALASIAFIPSRFWEPGQLAPDTMSVFISMFLHGGWLHLGGNMLYLWIFGDNVEDRLGHVKYLVFYFACGIAATFAHAFMNPQSALPAVGASGAIAGVLGGYLVLFPHARVMTFIPIGFVVALRELPAILVLGLWFVLQIFTGAASLGARSLEEAGGVAYFAHIGGFIAGLILILLMARRRKTEETTPWIQP